MTDLDTLKAMFDRAETPLIPEPGRPYPGTMDADDPLPEGCQFFRTYAWGYEATNAPPPKYGGGFGGFYTEFVFDKDGALLAVWSWE